MDSQKLIGMLIEELSSRGGWWDSIDDDTQDEIKESLTEIVEGNPIVKRCECENEEPDLV